MELISNSRCFGGSQLRYEHPSQVLYCTMRFSVYLPPGARDDRPVPVIYWLSGLTCTDENFVQKAGAQQYAAKWGVALVVPDTSPRGEGVPDDPEGAWYFGLGAGFYVDATREPWRENYQMYSYISTELPELVERNLPLLGKRSIMGHSMGGHGAMTIALKNPDRYRSVSAFAPICAPSECAWGQHTFSRMLGDDQSLWAEYDTCALINKGASKLPLLVDQGGCDNFLADQLMPERLVEVCRDQAHPLEYRLRAGYDHSYFFVASFISEHIEYHARQLLQ